MAPWLADKVVDNPTMVVLLYILCSLICVYASLDPEQSEASHPVLACCDVQLLIGRPSNVAYVMRP